MNRTQALELPKHYKAALVDKVDVIQLALFGTTARDTTDQDSDIDILIAFDGS